jgi:hypothetical protein
MVVILHIELNMIILPPSSKQRVCLLPSSNLPPLGKRCPLHLNSLPTVVVFDLRDLDTS